MKKRRKIRPPTCPYCGARSVLSDISMLYPENKSKRKVYVCKNYPIKCDAYVFATRKNEPLGQLAKKELRQKRVAAHQLFNQLWETGIMSKGQSYQWLAAKFGLNPRYAHIACFGDYYCDQLIQACQMILKGRAVKKTL